MRPSTEKLTLLRWLLVGGVCAACSGVYVGGAGEGDGGPVTVGAASSGGDAQTSDTGGSARVFLDDDLADFAAGTFEGTRHADGRLVLAAEKTSGRFVSRVHDAGAEITFRSLRFVPGAAYAKHLPKKKGKETGYPTYAADMADNVLLVDFDGAQGALAGDTPITDASGNANAATIAGSGEALTAGPWGTALRDGTAGYVRIPITAAGGLNLGASDATWALWVRTTQPCPSDNAPFGNRVYLGSDEETSDSTHMWLGCSTSLGPCGGATSGRLAGTLCSRRSPSEDCVNYCGARTVNDGRWHHLALVKQGHAPGTLRTYVDGRADGPAVATTFTTPFAFGTEIELAIGAFSRGTFQSEGDFDEVAIWRRALSEREISGTYRRGALAASLRVRVCQKADCSDAPKFVGPGGGDAPFVDPDGELGAPGPLPLVLPRGRYVQYEIALSSLVVTESPEIFSVELRGE